MIDTVRDHWVGVYRREIWTPALMVLLSLWYWIHPFLAFFMGGTSLYFAGVILRTSRGQLDNGAGILVFFFIAGVSLTWRTLIVFWPGLALFVRIEGPIESMDLDEWGELMLGVAGGHLTVPKAVARAIEVQDYVRLWVGMSGQVHSVDRREFRPLAATGLATAASSEPLVARWGAPRPVRWRRIYALSGWSEAYDFFWVLASTSFITALGGKLFVDLYREGLSALGEASGAMAVLMWSAIPASLVLMAIFLRALGQLCYGLVALDQEVVLTIDHLEARGDTGVVTGGAKHWALPEKAYRMLAIGDVVRITARAASQTVVYVDLGLMDAAPPVDPAEHAAETAP